jgi:hypothetical protein
MAETSDERRQAGIGMRIATAILVNLFWFAVCFPTPTYLPLQTFAGWLILNSIFLNWYLTLTDKKLASRFAGAFFGAWIGGAFLFLRTPIPDHLVLLIIFVSPVIGQALWRWQIKWHGDNDPKTRDDFEAAVREYEKEHAQAPPRPAAAPPRHPRQFAPTNDPGDESRPGQPFAKTLVTGFAHTLHIVALTGVT